MSEYNLRWLTNIYDPYADDAMCYVATEIDENPIDAWRRHQNWLNTKIIGRPQATAVYSVERLEEMGMVGVYEYIILPAFLDAFQSILAGVKHEAY